MSGFSYPQPIFISPIYNPAFYLSLDANGYLTYEYAQTLYLGKNDYRLTYITGITPGVATQGTALVPDTNNDISGIGTISCTSLIINGSTVLSAPAYTLGITPGTASLGKAIVLDGSGSISTIASLTATVITGTLQTAVQANITSLGTLSGLTIGGNLSFTDGSRSLTGLTTLTATSITGTIQTAAQPNITSIGSLSSLTATSITGTLQTAAQPNITSLGTLTALTIGGNLTFTGASQSLTGLTTLTATSITGTIQTAAQPNITSLGTLTGLALSGNLSGTGLTISGSLTVSGNINGFLSYGNQTSITTLGPLTELGVNTSATTEYFGIKGSGTSYLDGSYTRMVRFVGSNSTPVEFQIEVHNGSLGTSTNASWIGNITANDLRFGTGNSTQMVLKSSGLLGIGTTSPAAGVHCTNQASFTWGAGGSTVYRIRTSVGTVESALGPITYTTMGAIFNGYVGCEAIVMSSDRRLKRDIEDVPLLRVRGLYDEIRVKSYRWKAKANAYPEIGLIAQDVLDRGFLDLIEQTPDPDPNLEESSDPCLEPKGVKLTLNYPRLDAYNMRMIQYLMSEIEDLKKRIPTETMCGDT